MKIVPVLGAAVLFACGPAKETSSVTEKQPFSSAEATLLDFEFDGELVTSNSFGMAQVIEDQLLYTIGQLNGNRSVGRLDALELSDIRRTSLGDGTSRVSYHAKLPVAWGSKTDLPTSYTFVLPRRVDFTGLTAFTDAYRETCVDHSAHDVDSGSMWYYYRPSASGCELDPVDVIDFSPVISLSDENRNDTYPEYDRVWEDGSLIMVAIFGKNEDGATSPSDAGISAYHAFLRRVQDGFTGETIEGASPDVTIRVALGSGRTLVVHALLVDNVRTAGATFDTRYNTLSTEADVIAYNGHAGLGANIRALARKGSFRAGKYQIFFMNGCDTFAYVDGALAEARAFLNPDDPTGTKYMEIVTNAMPSYFHQNARADMAFIRGLISVDAPMTYQAIFGGIDWQQVVVVTGDEDNAFRPGGGDDWEGMSFDGAVVRGQELRFVTPVLRPGTYEFTISGTGDADLYVLRGQAPAMDRWDCRPYTGSSNERCVLTLNENSEIHVMVHGYSAANVSLRGRVQ
jgi:hypothetical protein